MKRILMLAAAAMATASLAADGATGQTAPSGPNYSSHAAAFFTGLLKGRVWILERPNTRRAGDRNMVWAHYHGPDGALLACAHLGGVHASASARWRIVPSRRFRALYNYVGPDMESDPSQRRGHTPIFYDPATGGLHNEALEPASGAWKVASRGWVQESWPRAMKDACPDLELPAGLPVNEKQTSIMFHEMMALDANAPVRGLPGARLRGPGAAGIAALNGRSALPAAALKTIPGRGTSSYSAGTATSCGCWIPKAPSPIPAISFRRRAAPRSRFTTNACRCGPAIASGIHCRFCPPENASPRCG